MAELRSRIDAVRAQMARDGIDVCVISENPNIMWLTGFERVFDDEPAHRLVISAHRTVIFSDSRYADALNRAAALAHEADADVNWEIDTVRGGLSRRCTALIAELGAQIVAVEDTMTIGEYRVWEQSFKNAGVTAELREVSRYVLNLRAVKTADEIKALKAAQAITDAAFAHICEYLTDAYRVRGEKLTERTVQLELDNTMRMMGAEDLAFDTIMASGANAAAPHSIPGEKVIEEGDMIVMDFGARLNGYHSDMTRMVCIGDPGEKARHAFATIRRANEEVEAMLKPGVIGQDAHNHAEDVLEQEGFGGCMGHSLGHGVGLVIHEQPTLSPANDKPLQVGNVVTVEPGIYISGEFGCRLEDCGVVTEDGFEVFTQSPHELVII